MDRTRTSLRLAAALITVALALPAAASATDYCVANPACVTGGGVDKGTGTTGLLQALTTADAHADVGGPDRVLVGPGTYNHVGTGALAAFVAADGVIVQGAGPATVLTRDAIGSSPVLSVDASSRVSDLAIVVPGASGMTGVELYGQADGLTVSSTLSAQLAFGVNEHTGATLTHATVTIPGGAGVGMVANTTVADSTIVADQGIDGSAGLNTVLRSRIRAVSYGILTYYSTLVVQDTLIDLGGHPAIGVFANANGNGDSTAVLRHLTIVNGGSTGGGLVVSSNGGKASTATLRDSVIDGTFSRPIVLAADGGGSTAALTTSYSSYDAAAVFRSGTSSAVTPPAPAATHLLTAAPGFVDAAGGDWHLRANSPLVDAGTPGPLDAGESTTDADGLPRLAGAARDPGAFEVQPPAAPSVVPPGTGPAPIAAPGVAPTVPAPLTWNTVAKPVLSALAFSPRAFRAGTDAHLGTRLTYKLSAAATVTFRVERPETGHRSGAACAAHGKGKKCTRYVVLAGKVSQKGAKGTNTLRFTGRLGKTTLKPGAYRLVAQPAAGAAVRTAFTVEKAKRR
ncbi:MAG TPA: choice-of-anchor Q domain-containing protein [Baekduia sp.]